MYHERFIELNRALGTALALTRIRKGIKQKDLAERLGLTPSYISLIEHGNKSPTFRTLHRICFQIGIKDADILRLTADILDERAAIEGR